MCVSKYSLLLQDPFILYEGKKIKVEEGGDGMSIYILKNKMRKMEMDVRVRRENKSEN